MCIFFIVNEDHMVRQLCGRNVLTSPYGQNGVLQLLLDALQMAQKGRYLASGYGSGSATEGVGIAYSCRLLLEGPLSTHGPRSHYLQFSSKLQLQELLNHTKTCRLVTLPDLASLFTLDLMQHFH